MHRTLLTAAALPFLLSLAGCPIYGPEDPNACLDCGEGGQTSAPECTKPGDCAANETCGADLACHPGSCEFWGCASGYQCVVEASGASCQPSGTSGQGGGGGGGGGEPQPVWCGHPGDCGALETCGPDGTCQAGDCSSTGCVFGFVCAASGEGVACLPQNPAACGTDADCALLDGPYACVSGLCTHASDQCFDQTQCPSGSVCADGKCTPACSASSSCPSAYQCDTSAGICAEPTEPCSITNDCGSADEVCVDGACVPRAVSGSCPTGYVWVQNGCIPNQSALFTCQVDGTQDACASGSICLNHSCFISCEAPNEGACSSLAQFDQCKPVSSSSGEHAVCGSSTNLGGECGPAGPDCGAGLVCIDGYCR